MQSDTQHKQIPTGTRGIIDTVGWAFALLNRRPYLIWLPILIDVVLWSGLRIFVERPTQIITDQSARLSDFAPGLRGLVDDLPAQVELLGLAANAVPSAMTGPVGTVGGTLIDGSELTVTGVVALPLALLGVFLSFVTGMGYLSIVGNLVTGRPVRGMRLAHQAVSRAFQFTGILLIACALFVLLMLPFLVIGVGLLAFGIDPVTLWTTAGVLLLIWFALFFSFGAHALVMHTSSPAEAIRMSYMTIQGHLLPALGLFSIVLLIVFGMPRALAVFAESPWGVPFAIIANAFTGTVLVTATMLFYRDRSASTMNPSMVAGAEAT